MLKIIRGLGKKVQSLFKKIFGKKENAEPKEFTSLSLGWDEMEFTVDGFKVSPIQIVKLDDDNPPLYEWKPHWQCELSCDNVDINDDLLKQLCGNDDDEMKISAQEFSWLSDELKKILNTPRTFLPKPYWCETLLVSVAANQQSTYQAVDLSQYEEKGLAHLIIGRMESWDELFQDYDSETEECLRGVAEEDGFISAYIGAATLYHYEDLGIWSYEEAEDIDDDSDNSSMGLDSEHLDPEL